MNASAHARAWAEVKKRYEKMAKDAGLDKAYAEQVKKLDLAEFDADHGSARRHAPHRVQPLAR